MTNRAPVASSPLSSSGLTLSTPMIFTVPPVWSAGSHADHPKCEAGESAADKRPQHRDRRVAPVRRCLSSDWKQRMRDTRAQIARRIDGIAGRAAERESDAPDQA